MTTIIENEEEIKEEVEERLVALQDEFDIIESLTVVYKKEMETHNDNQN